MSLISFAVIYFYFFLINKTNLWVKQKRRKKKKESVYNIVYIYPCRRLFSNVYVYKRVYMVCGYPYLIFLPMGKNH